MVRFNKRFFAKLDNQCIQISIAHLETVTLWHQTDIDLAKMNLSMMLKSYLRDAMDRNDLEKEAGKEWIKQNSSISELERNIILENQYYDAALKEYNSKPAPNFYELWKKEAMVRENFQLYRWRKLIRSMHDKLANEKENSLATPLAKQFIDNYVEEKIAEQSDNQKRAQEILLNLDALSYQRRVIVKIDFQVGPIRNRDTKITVNGDIKDLINLMSQKEQIEKQLLEIQLGEKLFS